MVAAPSGTVVATPTAIRPGMGRVETITALPQSAAAGGTAMRRYGIKMDDGTVQYVDSSAAGIFMGERIELAHRAGNRDVFARGALHAASRLAGREPGLYGVSDLLE